MKIRKAILTGGGRATRLHPITTTINKHLLPLANKPMIFHAIEKVLEVGVREIFINVNPGEEELQKYIGDGGHWGVKISYFEQTGGPQGIAHVVNEAKEFIGNDPFIFYLSDNILLGSLQTLVDTFHSEKYHCMLALSEVPDPERFGVPVFNEKKELVDVLEKPAEPPNNFAVTGIYLYGPKVFFESYQNITPSARGEYEISSIHSDFLRRGLNVGSQEITGWWKDTGKTEDLLIANKLLLDQLEKEAFPNHGSIDPSAVLKGNIHIGIGSRILKGVSLEGPVIIGENCLIEDAHIGPYVTIGAGTDIRGARIEDSIILDNATIHVPLHITESIIGKKAEIRQRTGPEKRGHRMIIGDKSVIDM